MVGASSGLNLGLFSYPFVDAIWGTAGMAALVTFDLAVNQWCAPAVLLPACRRLPQAQQR